MINAGHLELPFALVAIGARNDGQVWVERTCCKRHVNIVGVVRQTATDPCRLLDAGLNQDCVIGGVTFDQDDVQVLHIRRKS